MRKLKSFSMFVFLFLTAGLIITGCEGGGSDDNDDKSGTAVLSKSDVVFAYGSEDDATAILRMNDSTGTTTLVASAADVFLVLPSVSLDRKKIAYYDYTNDYLKIFDLNTNTTTDITPSSNFMYFGDLAIALSPDGSKLAYTDYNLDTNGNLNYHIWVISTGSTNPAPVQLTNCSTGMDRFPTWSPDGTKIAFIHTDTSNNAKIYSVNADGTSSDPYGNELFSQDAINGDSMWYLSWSPVNSNLMACSSRISSTNVKFSIYMLNLTAKTRTKLTDNTSAHEYNPRWSKDGNFIFYDENDNIYYNPVSNSGNSPTQLTADGMSSFDGWTPSE